jgi:hypothetical protein
MTLLTAFTILVYPILTRNRIIMAASNQKNQNATLTEAPGADKFPPVCCLTFFSGEEGENSGLVFMVDRSGSMSGAPMKTLLQVLPTFIREHLSGIPVVGACFHTTFEVIEDGNQICINITPEQYHTLLRGRMGGTSFRAMTKGAVKGAKALIESGCTTVALFLLTDGQSSDHVQAKEIVDGFMNGIPEGVQVNAFIVNLGRGADDQAMQEITGACDQTIFIQVNQQGQTQVNGQEIQLGDALLTYLQPILNSRCSKVLLDDGETQVEFNINLLDGTGTLYIPQKFHNAIKDYRLIITIDGEVMPLTPEQVPEQELLSFRTQWMMEQLRSILSHIHQGADASMTFTDIQPTLNALMTMLCAVETAQDEQFQDKLQKYLDAIQRCSTIVQEDGENKKTIRSLGKTLKKTLKDLVIERRAFKRNSIITQLKEQLEGQIRLIKSALDQVNAGALSAEIRREVYQAVTTGRLTQRQAEKVASRWEKQVDQGALDRAEAMLFKAVQAGVDPLSTFQQQEVCWMLFEEFGELVAAGDFLVYGAFIPEKGRNPLMADSVALAVKWEDVIICHQPMSFLALLELLRNNGQINRGPHGHPINAIVGALPGVPQFLATQYGIIASQMVTGHFLHKPIPIEKLHAFLMPAATTMLRGCTVAQQNMVTNMITATGEMAELVNVYPTVPGRGCREPNKEADKVNLLNLTTQLFQEFMERYTTSAVIPDPRLSIAYARLQQIMGVEIDLPVFWRNQLLFWIRTQFRILQSILGNEFEEIRRSLLQILVQGIPGEEVELDLSLIPTLEPDTVPIKVVEVENAGEVLIRHKDDPLDSESDDAPEPVLPIKQSQMSRLISDIQDIIHELLIAPTPGSNELICENPEMMRISQLQLLGVVMDRMGIKRFITAQGHLDPDMILDPTDLVGSMAKIMGFNTSDEFILFFRSVMIQAQSLVSNGLFNEDTDNLREMGHDEIVTFFNDKMVMKQKADYEIMEARRIQEICRNLKCILQQFIHDGMPLSFTQRVIGAVRQSIGLIIFGNEGAEESMIPQEKTFMPRNCCAHPGCPAFLRDSGPAHSHLSAIYYYCPEGMAGIPHLHPNGKGVIKLILHETGEFPSLAQFITEMLNTTSMDSLRNRTLRSSTRFCLVDLWATHYLIRLIENGIEKNTIIGLIAEKIKKDIVIEDLYPTHVEIDEMLYNLKNLYYDWYSGNTDYATLRDQIPDIISLAKFRKRAGIMNLSPADEGMIQKVWYEYYTDIYHKYRPDTTDKKIRTILAEIASLPEDVEIVAPLE